MFGARRTLAGTLTALCTGALIASCGGDGGEGQTGTVNVAITDAPVDSADAVWLQVSGIAFKPEGSAPEIVQNFTPRQLNLLQYQQGDVAVLLENVPFKAGRYQWLRLLLDAQNEERDSYLMIAGQECELKVPSGAESGLKMNRGFTIPADGSLALTIDFDLRKSLHAPPGQASGACTSGYLLRPTLRLVDDANVGAISGSVTFEGGAMPENCLPKVYVYEGAVLPDDLEETSADTPDVDPLVVTGVTVPAGSSSGSYKAAFVPAGDYTVAFSCDDDTEADEELAYAPATGAGVAVQNNLITTFDFTVPVPSG